MFLMQYPRLDCSYDNDFQSQVGERAGLSFVTKIAYESNLRITPVGVNNIEHFCQREAFWYPPRCIAQYPEAQSLENFTDYDVYDAEQYPGYMWEGLKAAVMAKFRTLKLGKICKTFDLFNRGEFETENILNTRFDKHHAKYISTSIHKISSEIFFRSWDGPIDDIEMNKLANLIVRLLLAIMMDEINISPICLIAEDKSVLFRSYVRRICTDRLTRCPPRPWYVRARPPTSPLAPPLL